MKYSVINKQKLNDDFRIDADFYMQNFIKLDILLNNKNTVLELCDTFDLQSNGAFKDIFKILNDGNKKTVPYIRSGNVGDFFVNHSDLEFISSEAHNKLSKTHTKLNDILMARKGKIGGATIITEDSMNFNSNDNVVNLKVKDIQKVNPYYLTTFLNSKYGLMQIDRYSTGNVQPWLSMHQIRNLRIILFNINFQKNIQEIVQNAYKSNVGSKRLYKKIEDLLLKELNFINWEPKHKLWSVKKYSDVQSTNRCDAEYFQPKYDEIIKKIKEYSNGWSTFESLININDKNITPEENNEYGYIELSNITNNGEITGYTKDIGKYLPTRARRIVKTNDVILSSIEGSLDSIALITKQYNNCFCSNGFYVINSEYYNSETLLCLMKSVIGQLQLKKGCSGTILTAISKEELNKIILPKIKKETQNIIKEKIQQMYKLKESSKQLLEIAKRGVEIAIEENEDFAVNWINEQLSKIGVEL